MTMPPAKRPPVKCWTVTWAGTLVMLTGSRKALAPGPLTPDRLAKVHAARRGAGLAAGERDDVGVVGAARYEGDRPGEGGLDRW